MNIEFSPSSTASVHHCGMPLFKHTSSSPYTVEGDVVHTSTAALQLSRNLALLKEQLLPRTEFLQQFADNLDAPVELDASSLDHILNQL